MVAGLRARLMRRTPEAEVKITVDVASLFYGAKSAHRAVADKQRYARPPDRPELASPIRPTQGLHSILRLHFAQEEENYLPLLEERPAAPLRRWRRA